MSLMAELKRRNVFRVAAAYAVLSWLLLQVGDVLFETLELPSTWNKGLLAVLALGLIPALVFSWVYELTPDGIKKESEIDASDSVSAHTGRKLDVALIVLLIMAIGLFAFDRFGSERSANKGSVSFSPTDAGKLESAEENDADPFFDDAAPSLAVLAFQNMSDDASNEYFADGISEEILNLLTDIDALSVASRTSAFAFKGTSTPIPEIAQALKVRYVLEGSVRKAGNQVRITAQLIDAGSDRHLWSETYDRTLEDIFAIQDEIAQAIGSALKVELLGDAGNSIRAEAIDPQVYAQFLEARHLLRSRVPENIRIAEELLEGVVEAEPGFGRGHVVLGEAYLLRWDDPNPEQVVENARQHAEIARSLNPALGGIDLILGSIAEFRTDRVAAVEHYSRAIELEPDEPRAYHWRGMLYAEAGYPDRCRSDLERAVDLEPLNPNSLFALAGCLHPVVGDFDAAIAATERSMSLNRSGSLGMVMMIELNRGDLDAAAAALERNVELKESNLEDWSEISRLIESASRGERVDIQPQPGNRLHDRPDLLLLLGYVDEYLDIVQTLDDPRPGVLPAAWAPRFAEMRRDPRFLAIMDRTGMTGLWRHIGPPPDCRVEGDGFSCGHGASGSGAQ